MIDVSQMEAMAEGVALMVAQYYQSLVRCGIPKPVAERLATHYQQMYFVLIISQRKEQ